MRAVVVTGVAGVVGALLCVACDPVGPTSEQGRYRLTDHGLAVRIGFLDDNWTGEPVLVGERTCPTLDCLQAGCDELTPPDGGIAACVEQTVTGASRTDDCVTFDVAGSISWEVRPIACEPPPDAGPALEADRFDFVAVDAASVVAEQQPRIEQYARDWIEVGELISEPALPEGFGEPRAALRVIEGGQAPVTAVLRTIDGGELVAVAGSSAALDGVTPTPRAVRWTEDGLLEAEAGASATLRVVRGAASFDVATISGVSVTEAASMTLFAFYWTDPEEPGFSSPVAVHAVVRDAQGRALDGAPVEWTLVRGDVATNSLVAELDDVPDDGEGLVRRGPWLWVGDVCRPPSARVGRATALLRARLGFMSESVELGWVLPPDAPEREGAPSRSPTDDDSFEREPACPNVPACGCANTASGSGASPPIGGTLFAIALVALVLARKRSSQGAHPDGTRHPWYASSRCQRL